MIEHIGIELWRAALAWKEQLHGAMVERGHKWYADARATIAIHLDPQGMSQSDLVARIGLTKQAVNQLLDSLEADGVIRRETDPNNRRRKNIVYTELGLASVRDANIVKREIEASYRARLGDETFEILRVALSKLLVAGEDDT